MQDSKIAVFVLFILLVVASVQAFNCALAKKLGHFVGLPYLEMERATYS
ncbi:hypothetical protein HQ489_02115 [Candidatus Woesearchaeota archaeon]|nr:hypothetical protein [Candidatus Woesearchaeota archaeon]